MGQEITVSRAGGRVAVGAHLRPQPVDHRHGDRAVLVGREGRRADRPPDVLARRLFDLGADTVTVYSSAVTVEAPERWAELEPKVIETIEHLFGYYGDDAGWSPDALRAIGVEPLPTPEPTA